MVTIALPADIEGPLTEQARKRGMTPEQLALETLRSTFTAGAAADGPEGRTLFDFLSGYIGTIEGSAENLSQDSGQLFAEGLASAAT
jgi:hypothetical protein